jgi:hypothetical protein
MIRCDNVLSVNAAAVFAGYRIFRNSSHNAISKSHKWVDNANAMYSSSVGISKPDFCRIPKED